MSDCQKQHCRYNCFRQPQLMTTTMMQWRLSGEVHQCWQHCRDNCFRSSDNDDDDAVTVDDDDTVMAVRKGSTVLATVTCCCVRTEIYLIVLLGEIIIDCDDRRFRAAALNLQHNGTIFTLYFIFLLITFVYTKMVAEHGTLQRALTDIIDINFIRFWLIHPCDRRMDTGQNWDSI